MEGYPDPVSTVFILLNVKQCMQYGTQVMESVSYLYKKPCTMAKNFLHH
jgi:hypothetical protein